MLRVVEPPEITKEMLDAMKLHLRIDHDEEDDLIKTLMGLPGSMRNYPCGGI